jgi:hypothetical protein
MDILVQAWEDTNERTPAEPAIIRGALQYGKTPWRAEVLEDNA